MAYRDSDDDLLATVYQNVPLIRSVAHRLHEAGFDDESNRLLLIANALAKPVDRRLVATREIEVSPQEKPERPYPIPIARVRQRQT